jgi:hypothetical protein
VKNGRLQFDPALLSEDEFIQVREKWALPAQTITLDPGQLGFSLCGIPVIYTRGNEKEVTVEFQDGIRKRFPGTSISEEISALVFDRSNRISRIEVHI